MKLTRPATTVSSCRVSSAEMPAAAANAGRRTSTSGSALASLRTVAFTLDTARGDLRSGGLAAAFGVRSPAIMPSRPGDVNRTRIAPSDLQCVQRIAATCGESPMWSVREQALYWTDNLGGVIYRLEPESGNAERFPVGQNVMAIALRARGGLVLALAKQLFFYERGGELEPIEAVERDQPTNRFNDGKVDPQGRLWAGTMDDVGWAAPSGSLCRLDPSLDLSRLQGEVVCANGLGWSPDARTFYFGESFRYAIFAYDFDPDAGTLSARRAFATLDRSGGAFPDGLTVDAEGG